MRVSYNWLRDYVDFDLSPSDLADRLTMAGLEVEETLDRYAWMETVIPARVAEVRPHPNSDHLRIAMVEAEGSKFEVVCGAPNLRPGMISAQAMPGTELPGGRVVEETEIRGVVSRGMLCSEAEMVIGPDASGIIDLTEKARPGQSLKEVLGLGDWIFEIGVTPNRADALSYIGVARDIAGLLGLKLKYPEFSITEDSESIHDLTSVKVFDPDHCPRYAARVIRDVKIGPSPFWMVDRLTAAGLRPISNIVDITNFVLLELGQPLHAFDMDRLEENRIEVMTAEEGDRFVTLDGTERLLGPEMLMICDGRRPVGVAGVMGGLNSEIYEDTRNVLLESAFFNPVSIRRTSKNLGLSTEASYRFERGVDIEGCVFAADRAAALMAELAGGKVAAGVIDEYPVPHKRTVVGFSPAKCNTFLGTDFPEEDILSALENIELQVERSPEGARVEIPGFRVDIEREVDLFEEAARLLGFDRIPASLPPARVEPIPKSPVSRLRGRGRELMIGLGFNEIITYSFIHEEFPDRLGLPAGDPRRRTVRLVNPLSEDQVLMRTTLVPGLIEVLRRNQSYEPWSINLFETGRVFFERPGEDLPEEREALAGLMAGYREPESFHSPRPEPVDFFEIKGRVEQLLRGLGVREIRYDREDLPSYYSSGRSARILSESLPLGFIGRLSPRAAKKFDLRAEWGPAGAIYLFEIDLASALEAAGGPVAFEPLPRFPSVERDLTVNVAEEVEASEIITFIRSLGEDRLAEITCLALFDAPEKVGAGRKNLSYRLVFRDPDRTLTAEEVNEIHSRTAEKVFAEYQKVTG